MSYFLNSEGAIIIKNMIIVIQSNKALLGQIDGEIGDGDHGVNMNKGFTMAGERITPEDSFTDAMRILSQVLLQEIGGSMGPLYGTFFRTFARMSKGIEQINPQLYLEMLKSATAAVMTMGGAIVGDKTLIDTLNPACITFEKAVNDNLSFKQSLSASVTAAEIGKNATKDMISRIGRSARLGERSRGVLDAGAVSSYLILESMSLSIKSILHT
jgi:dihydroxyacetone kinase-like protein